MRRPTPNIMDELLPEKSETAQLRSGLKWDYSQLGDAAGAVIEHTIEIKRNERRANEAIIETGRHLIAVKESLSHGQWGDWLATEFAMSDSTAHRLMNIAKRFEANSPTLGNLSYSVLAMLTSKSVPESAVEEVVQRSQAGETVTVQAARAVINQHKPTRPVALSPSRRYAAGLPPLDLPANPAAPAWSQGGQPLTEATLVEALLHVVGGGTLDMAQQRQVLKGAMLSGRLEPTTAAALECYIDLRSVSAEMMRGAAHAAYMRWLAANSESAYTAADVQALQPTPRAADSRVERARRLIDLYRQAISTEDEYGALTGSYSDWLAPKRSLQKCIDRLQWLVDVLEVREVENA